MKSSVTKNSIMKQLVNNLPSKLFTAAKLFTTTVLCASSIVTQASDNTNKRLPIDLIEGEMSIITLGTGAAIARPDAGGRAGNANVIFIEGKPKIILDTGSGAFTRLAESGINISDVDLILETNLRIDHASGLTPFVQSMFFERSNPVSPGNPRTTPLKIFGPAANGETDGGPSQQMPGIAEHIERIWNEETGLDRHLHALFDQTGTGDFEWEVTEIDPSLNLPARTIYEEDGLVIRGIGVEHTNGVVPTISYSIEYKGHKLVYSGDFNGNTDNILQITQDADLFIVDSSPPANFINRNHVTPGRIGELASLANVRNLMLNHITVFSEDSSDQIKALINEGGYNGPIVEAQDLGVYNFSDPILAYEGYPYSSHFITVQGRDMHYLDVGDGENTIVMLHGNPTAAYLWRDVIPHLQGNNRVIVPDLLNHGNSETGYGMTFADHLRAFEEFMSRKQLKNVVLVIHDWGGLIGFAYASRHQDNVKGITFFEAPVRAYEKETDLPPILADIRAGGKEPILETNFFIESVLFGTEPQLTEADRAVYRAPFEDLDNRLQTYIWVQEVPVRETSNQSIELIDTYSEYLLQTEIPKLYFYANPGIVNSAGGFQSTDYILANFKNIQPVFLGDGDHFLQERFPNEMGSKISEWVESTFND